MSDDIEMRQAKCRKDYKAVVKQSRQLMEILEANNAPQGPQKKQKRSKNSEAEKTAPAASCKKIDRKELEETIRGFLQELE